MPAAARLGDPIGHSPTMSWLLKGLLIGAAIAVAGVAIVGTGGLAAVAVVGAGAAMGAGLGEAMSTMSFAGKEVTGAIAMTGSSNVFVNSLAAARAHVDMVACSKHPGPIPIATGSGQVYINGMPAARVDDKTGCSAVITKGSGNVYIGGGTMQTDTINPENLVPGWVHASLLVVGVGSAIILAGPVIAVGGLVGAYAGGIGGGWVGGKMFGEGSDGQKWSAIAGSFLGGYLGAKAAPGAWDFAQRVQVSVEPGTLGMNGGNVRISLKQNGTGNVAEPPAGQGSYGSFKQSTEGPTTIAARDPVNLAAQRRLNSIDPDRNTHAPGEAGAAAEMEHYLGGTLERAQGGTSADYVVKSGEFAGARIDFKLTPDTFEQATKINTYFDKSFPKFSKSIADKLAKPSGVDMMPFDTRFLSPANKQKLFDFINTLPKTSQQKVIYLE
jgi:uncharacterized Zn-binding protein involved in type VI secretion